MLIISRAVSIRRVYHLLRNYNMKNKSIIITLLILVVFVGLLVWGYFQNSGANNSLLGASNSTSQLSAPEKQFDFGRISMKNGDVSKEFTVTNSTDKDILVRTLLTSCMCTSAFIVGPDAAVKGPFGMPGHLSVPLANEIIKAGESRIIRVVFNPNAHGPAGIGVIKRAAILTDKEGGTLSLEIRAEVTP